MSRLAVQVIGKNSAARALLVGFSFWFCLFSPCRYRPDLSSMCHAPLSNVLLSYLPGRRSRRNSLSEDSQLTIENFGGSQDQLNMIGTTVDRRSQDRERKISTASNATIEPALPVRSSLADARGTIQIGYDSDVEKEDRETEKLALKRQNSTTSSSNSSGLQLEEKRKMASFASLTPSTTTWQQQSLNTNQLNENRKHPFVPHPLAALNHFFSFKVTLISR